MKTINTYKKEFTPGLVSIITVNYNQPEVTLELLESLKNISYPLIETIVVDNASTVNIERIKESNLSFTLINSQTNLGFAGGNNLGLEYAHGEFILFINNDVEVEIDFLEALVLQLQSKKRIAAVSPKIKYYSSNKTIQYAGSFAVNPFTLRNKHVGTGELDHGQYDKPTQTSYAHGACMLVKNEIIQQIGSMDEQFFLYYEEQDWCERMNRNGYEIHYVPSSTVYHKESISTGKNSPLKTYYLTRNRILFARKNFSNFVFLISMLYMTFISIPKNTLVLLKERTKLIAYYQGIIWNLKNKIKTI